MADRKYPRHDFWGAGEPDCPPELKAPSGELRTMRCKVCGDGWRESHDVCMVALADTNPPKPVDHTWFSQAALDVLAERQRQISAEGWDAAHDNEHWDGSMAQAAACYALGNDGVSGKREFVSLWPWDRSDWKPKDDRRNLVRAAALILAEIERLDRASGSADGTGVLGTVETEPKGGA
jgi:hypothetical protein